MGIKGVATTTADTIATSTTPRWLERAFTPRVLCKRNYVQEVIFYIQSPSAAEPERGRRHRRIFTAALTASGRQFVDEGAHQETPPAEDHQHQL
ncbi:unnamed protein product [Phyllotreta striolata]|uniref:Uncharacterized protein n=1 Tax=Phyllotreta striolata TaxID=444603 RepID=A0A9N9TRX9_PHYSR|nr:unnamed protein product [Phyllotreta striolata]